MNWNRYLEIKKDHFNKKNCFWPENQTEAKQALALGVIDIGQYVEFSMTTEPLLDAVHDPDPNIRKETIRRIAEQKSPFSIRILHNMLSDPDEEVRLYAASEIDRLESEKQKKIHYLRETLKKNNQDQTTRFELAKTYIEYTNVLLTSKNLKFFFLKQAIELLNNLISSQSTNDDFYYYRGLAFKLMNEQKKALVDLKKSIQLNKQHINAFSTLAEIYFEQNKFNYVRKIMDILPVQKQDIEEINAQLFWKN